MCSSDLNGPAVPSCRQPTALRFHHAGFAGRVPTAQRSYGRRRKARTRTRAIFGIGQRKARSDLAEANLKGPELEAFRAVKTIFELRNERATLPKEGKQNNELRYRALEAAWNAGCGATNPGCVVQGPDSPGLPPSRPRSCPTPTPCGGQAAKSQLAYAPLKPGQHSPPTKTKSASLALPLKRNAMAASGREHGSILLEWRFSG